MRSAVTQTPAGPPGTAEGAEPPGPATTAPMAERTESGGDSSSGSDPAKTSSLQDPRAPLPTRTPLAQTPPPPRHIPPPTADEQETPEGLPRRRPAPPSEC